ncbi:MAG: glutamate racemase [Helicobacteraceae bacterium]|jgi:glutamate racemase|nr:glutamate racemase [Helicobacteraceae bacterium]
MKAAVFDSGIGGLSVVKSLLARRLFDEIIYYGDLARVPYGSKDPNTIIRYSLEALEFVNNFDADILIVACNTASSYALEELKKTARFPVLGVIEPGVLALKNSGVDKNDRVLVIGTKATINSDSYQRLLFSEGYKNVTAIATPLLVPLVEEKIFEGAIVDEVFKYYFGKLDGFDAVIMGCTHYPMISGSLANWFNNAKLVHSGDAIVEWIEKQGVLAPIKGETKLRLFASENVNHLKEVASQWLNLP